jgi:predicted SAM-dependent methyltransferase
MDISQYFAAHAERKLHIGCGANVLSGWLNSDFPARARDVLNLDATQAFPFQDGTFNYVFSEHMIEHIPYLGGMSILN